jgi:hypothetical protein
MGSVGTGALAVWASTAWSLCEGRLGDRKSSDPTEITVKLPVRRRYHHLVILFVVDAGTSSTSRLVLCFNGIACLGSSESFPKKSAAEESRCM